MIIILAFHLNNDSSCEEKYIAQSDMLYRNQ